MRKSRAVVTVLAAALALLFVPSPALAQDTEAQQRTAAEALFEEAARLMASGRAAEACPKLVEVVRLQPAGIGAKMKLGECYEAAKLLASAYAAYGFAARAASAAGDERAATASERAAALKPRLSTLTIVVPADGPPDLEVRRNGVVVGRGQWSAAIPVDGGPQRIEGAANGYELASATSVVPDEGGAVIVALPALVSRSTNVSVSNTTPPVATSDRDGESVPAWVWVSGGAGLALGAVAIGFAVDQNAAASAIVERCGEGRDRCPDGYDADADREREQLDFGLFVGLGAAGAVALSAAVVGLVIHGTRAPPQQSARVTAWATPRAGFFGVAHSLP